MDYLVLLNLLLSGLMFGVILTIQFVHYPSFLWIDKQTFREFSSFHTGAITPIVATAMLSEFFVAILLVWKLYNYLTLFNLILIALAFLSTFCLSVPLHSKLSEGHDDQIINRLIKTNYPRTIIWAIKTAIAFWICVSF